MRFVGIRSFILVAAFAGGSACSGRAQENEDAAVGSEALSVPLFPAAVGRTWTYRNVWMPPGQPSATCIVTFAIVGTGFVDGRTAFRVRVDNDCDGSASPTRSEHWTHVEGDVLESRADAQATWARTLDEPVQLGHAWDPGATGYMLNSWESSGSITLATGTFTDCWTMRWGTPTIPIIGRNTYCRGVGMVTGDADYCPTCTKMTTELLSKNF